MPQMYHPQSGCLGTKLEQNSIPDPGYLRRDGLYEAKSTYYFVLGHLNTVMNMKEI